MSINETLKEIVKEAVVEFAFYRDGQLWYNVFGKDILFPVPVEDIGNATFHRRDKAILFMRYIRKHLETLEEARKDHE